MKLVFAVLPTVGGSGRDELLAKLAAISEYSSASEPGVLTYAVCVPEDTADTKTVYMLELYTDQAALDSHMQADIVKGMMASLGTVLEGAPTVLQLDLLQDIEDGLFVRHDVLDNTADPHIVVGEVPFKDGELLQKSLPYWAEVFKTVRDNEPGSLFYAFASSSTDPTMLYAIEAYTTKDYFLEVHAKSQAIQDSMQACKEWFGPADFKLNSLKKVSGFLARPKV